MRRALVAATSERYFGLVVNFATLAVVSRLLTPAEIGVSVLGTAILLFAAGLREFATTNFLIQKEILRHEDIRTASTVLLLLMLAIWGLLVACAGPMAGLFKDEGLAPYIRVAATAMLIETVVAPISALLRRQMRFELLAAINVTSTLVGSATTIGLALLGYSYMSFAWGWMGAGCTLLVLSFVVWKDRSIFRPCLAGWRAMFVFGCLNGTNMLLYSLYEGLPYLVFGRLLSLDAIGFYNRAIAICQLPDKIILGGANSVLLSAFSAHARDGTDLRRSYVRAIELITAVQWPALIGLAILAHPIIVLVLGDQWIAVVPLVQIMALASLFSFSSSLDYPILVATGAMHDVLMRSLIVWPVSALILTGAAFFGLTAVALAWFLATPFRAFVATWFVRRRIGVSWAEILAALGRGGVLALFSAAGPLIMIMTAGMRFDVSLGAAVIAVMLGVLGWSVGLWLIAHPLLSEIRHAALAAQQRLPASAMAMVPVWRQKGGCR